MFTLRAIGYAVRGHARDIRAEHRVQRSEQHLQERETGYSSTLDDHYFLLDLLLLLVVTEVTNVVDSHDSV